MPGRLPLLLLLYCCRYACLLLRQLRNTQPYVRTKTTILSAKISKTFFPALFIPVFVTSDKIWEALRGTALGHARSPGWRSPFMAVRHGKHGSYSTSFHPPKACCIPGSFCRLNQLNMHDLGDDACWMRDDACWMPLAPEM